MTTILHVLQHALGRNQYGKNPHGRPDYRDHFCAGADCDSFDVCRAAVAQGLMTEHPPSDISGGDFVFVVTPAGKAYVAKHSPPEPKRTRSQERYRRFLESDGVMSFGEWIRRAP